MCWLTVTLTSFRWGTSVQQSTEIDVFPQLLQESWMSQVEDGAIWLACQHYRLSFHRHLLLPFPRTRKVVYILVIGFFFFSSNVSQLSHSNISLSLLMMSHRRIRRNLQTIGPGQEFWSWQWVSALMKRTCYSILPNGRPWMIDHTVFIFSWPRIGSARRLPSVSCPCLLLPSWARMGAPQTLLNTYVTPHSNFRGYNSSKTLFSINISQDPDRFVPLGLNTCESAALYRFTAETDCPYFASGKQGSLLPSKERQRAKSDPSDDTNRRWQLMYQGYAFVEHCHNMAYIFTVPLEKPFLQEFLDSLYPCRWRAYAHCGISWHAAVPVMSVTGGLLSEGLPAGTAGLHTTACSHLGSADPGMWIPCLSPSVSDWTRGKTNVSMLSHECWKTSCINAFGFGTREQ